MVAVGFTAAGASLSLIHPSFQIIPSTCSSPTMPSITCSSPLPRVTFSLSSSSTGKLDFTIKPSPLAATRSGFHCNSNSSPGGSSPGENESKSILDAFFLGKAFAEAVSERIESTIGELLSTAGMIQAEQQKQVQQFQEEVLAKAKRSKEKVAREAMEEQGLTRSSGITSSSTGTSSTSSSNSLSAHDTATSATSSYGDGQENVDKDPLWDVSIDS